jgi:hypothetical protein
LENKKRKASEALDMVKSDWDLPAHWQIDFGYVIYYQETPVFIHNVD